MIPSNIYITINKKISVNDIFDNADQEYLQKEGYSTEWIKNRIKNIVLNSVWDYIFEEDIKIEVE